jgi:hypothetical protein
VFDSAHVGLAAGTIDVRATGAFQRGFRHNFL